MIVTQQDVEKIRQQRSRIVQTLNVPLRVRLGPSLAAALLDGLFEHPAGVFSSCPGRVGHRRSKACCAEWVSRSLLGDERTTTC
jgi:hypothetical protein